MIKNKEEFPLINKAISVAFELIYFKNTQDHKGIKKCRKSKREVVRNVKNESIRLYNKLTF